MYVYVLLCTHLGRYQMSDLLLTPEEAASVLGLSTFTVRRLLREGELPGRKVGKRQWRIRRVDLDEYLSETSRPARPQSPSKRIGELAAEQGVAPVADFDLLLAAGWPEDGQSESVEEFLAPIRALRESSPAMGEI
jgi:excisionase family DNA binding protein